MDSSETDIIAINADSDQEAVQKFLGDNEDLQDDDFVYERFSFISNLVNSIVTWLAENPNVDKTSVKVNDFINGLGEIDLPQMREVLMNPTFRRLATKLLLSGIDNPRYHDLYGVLLTTPNNFTGKVFIFLTEVEGQSLWSINENLEVLVIPARNEKEAIEKFLDPNNPTPTLLKHFKFLDDVVLMQLDKNDIADSLQDNYLSIVEGSPSDYEQEIREMFRDPRFREDSATLLTTESDTNFLTWDATQLIKRIKGEIRNDLKNNNLRKLKGRLSVYCESTDPHVIPELVAMAKALGIRNPEWSQEWLCKEIGSILIISERTGIALSNLIPAIG